MEKTAVVVVCAKLTNPPLTGSVTGIQCKECKQELQCTAQSYKSIQNGGIPLCNPCGLKLKEQLTAKGTPMFLQFGPEALRKLKELNENQHSNN